MKSVVLYSESLIDPEIEFHYADHRSVEGITAEHTHNFFELFLIVGGEVVHVINGRREILGAGDLVFVRPSDVHYYEEREEKSCQLINLAFREATIRELFGYLGPGFPSGRLLGGPHAARVSLAMSERDILAARLSQLYTIPRDRKDRIRSALRVLLFDIFTRYFWEPGQGGGSGVPGWFSILVREMQKKENFVRGVEVLYELSHRTPEHISRVFRRFAGVTPTDFVNDLRLNYAANLLSNSDEKILPVAFEAGFGNPSHFYHLFRKKFGLSPAAFRKRTRRVAIPLSPKGRSPAGGLTASGSS
jgi:AraC family transcriptional regulator, dual regulator of chb operon